MPERPLPEALVLRFPPGGPDEVKKIRDEARYAHRHHQQTQVGPWYRLSTWTDVERPGEAVQETMTRLVQAAGLGRIRLTDPRNQVFWWTRAGELYRRGFDLVKDEFEGEPPEHWSVDLGMLPSVPIVNQFVEAFRGPQETGQYLP